MLSFSTTSLRGFLATFLGLALTFSATAQTDTTSRGGQLPVSLLDFSARNQDELIVLEWTTLDEDSLQGYNLQYSTDGQQYTDLVVVPARGGQEKAVFKYTLTHQPGEQEYHYYRLKARNGKGATEELGMVRIGRIGALTSTIYPNPARKQGFPTVVPSVHPSSIQLRDEQGTVKKTYKQSRKYSLLIPISEIKPGYHLVRVYKAE